MTQFAAAFGSRPCRRLFEIFGGRALGDQHVGILGPQPVLGDKARPLGVGQFRQFGAQPLDPFRVEFERQQVGVGKIAVVVRVLLRAHRPGHAAAAVEQPGLLLDRAALLDQLDLAGASYSIACMTKRTEFTFLISQRVPYCSPGRRTETLQSQRREPSSMLPSQVPR